MAGAAGAGGSCEHITTTQFLTHIYTMLYHLSLYISPFWLAIIHNTAACRRRARAANLIEVGSGEPRQSYSRAGGGLRPSGGLQPLPLRPSSSSLAWLERLQDDLCNSSVGGEDASGQLPAGHTQVPQESSLLSHAGRAKQQRWWQWRQQSQRNPSPHPPHLTSSGTAFLDRRKQKSTACATSSGVISPWPPAHDQAGGGRQAGSMALGETWMHSRQAGTPPLQAVSLSPVQGSRHFTSHPLAHPPSPLQQRQAASSLPWQPPWPYQLSPAAAPNRACRSSQPFRSWTRYRGQCRSPVGPG